MSGDEQAIRDLIELWMKASKAGDTETVLGLMTEDVVFQAVGKEPFGKKEFAAAAGNRGGAKVDGTSEIVELKVMGEFAYLRNRLRVTITPAGRAAMTLSGYTLTFLQKNGAGKWQIARDANLLVPEK